MAGVQRKNPTGQIAGLAPPPTGLATIHPQTPPPLVTGGLGSAPVRCTVFFKNYQTIISEIYVNFIGRHDPLVDKKQCNAKRGVNEIDAFLAILFYYQIILRKR